MSLRSSSRLPASKPDLNGHRAVITGGGTGIGKSIAEHYLAAGAQVAVSGRREAPLRALAEQYPAGQVLAVPSDVSDPSSCLWAIDQVHRTFGGLDVLVNNAGVARGGPVTDMTQDDLELVLDVDLKGPIQMMRAAYPLLTESANASVINISSSLTQGAIKDFSVYSAAKAGVEMMTRCLALEWAASQIRVNAISPGIVATPIFETMMPSEEVAGVLDHFDQAVPLGRVGQPADIASMALFLGSDLASFVTGAIITIDGGLSLAADGKA